MNWRIYYGDGSTYDGEPFAAPSLNVQAIAQLDDEVGRHVIAGFDFYWYEPSEDKWWGGEAFGLWDYLSRPGVRKVIFARTLLNEDYRAVFKRACEDPDFPVKSAMRTDEGKWLA